MLLFINIHVAVKPKLIRTSFEHGEAGSATVTVHDHWRGRSDKVNEFLIRGLPANNIKAFLIGRDVTNRLVSP